jgi:CRISPR-associated endonuclease/helicase Cas3
VRTFTEVFRAATGHQPYGYQERIARDGLPDVVQTPAGAGKTGVILAWLWRRLYGPDPGRTPRRLIYALPQRSLTEQVSGQVRAWLANLGLTDEIALYVAMGARWETQGEWRDDLHQPAIVVGTTDVLVSKALLRAFDLPPALFPIDFALTTNGAHWIIDEPQLSPQTTTTLRQLAGFAARLGTAEPFGLTCLSAAAPDELLLTPDNPQIEKAIQILDIERTGALATRLTAVRAVRRLPPDPGDYQAIASAVRDRHRPGTLTLVVTNTVDAAQRVYRQLRDGDARDCTLLHTTLLHSRFRAIERADRVAAATGGFAQPDQLGESTGPGLRADADADVPSEPGPSGGRIVVTTQVLEAGLDLDAALLVTEAAPWPSLIRRAGRCNRSGQRNADAELWWVPPPSPFPYRRQDIDATVRELDWLEGERLTTDDLLARDVPSDRRELAVLRVDDLDRLFDTDTESDPAGNDVNIAPYVLDAEGLDVQVAWATWTPGEDGAPDPEIRVPPAEFRCPVPIGDVAALARGRAVWRFDRQADGWTRVTPQLPSWPRPGEVLLVNAADGGYDAETGFDLAAPGPVADAPGLLTPEEWAERATLVAAEATRAAGGVSDAVADAEEYDPDRRWQSLDEHSEQVRDQAAALLAVLAPSIPPDAARGVILAAYLHDLGKAHEIWQDAICALASDEEQARIAAGRPWAKSGGNGALLFANGVAFRHELASLLLIDGPLAALLAESPDPDLTRYLVLAHHGKLRVQIREHRDPATPPVPPAPPVSAAHAFPPARALPPNGQPSASVIRGLRQGATSAVPPMLGQPATTLTVDLAQFQPGGDRSWTQTVLGLRDRYGPFVLAYLEAVVRISDWRASGGRELPTAASRRLQSNGLRSAPPEWAAGRLWFRRSDPGRRRAREAPGQFGGMARVEDLRLAEGGALPVVPPFQAELDKDANISAT